MPSKPILRFTAWSHSRWKDYTLCPLKAKLKHLEKIPEPSSPAAARGSDIHKKAELFVAEKQAELPEELALFKKEFAVLTKQRKVQTEEQWAFDQNWKEVDWFSRDARCRMVIDAYYFTDMAGGKRRMTIVDYKTGKVREENKTQLSLYALGAFEKFGVDEVICEFWYLDAGERVKERFRPIEVPIIKEVWADRATPMLMDTTFAPRPNYLCKNWCPYAKHKSGHCQY